MSRTICLSHGHSQLYSVSLTVIHSILLNQIQFSNFHIRISSRDTLKMSVWQHQIERLSEIRILKLWEARIPTLFDKLSWQVIQAHIELKIKHNKAYIMNSYPRVSR